jgi:hypothetical protein
MASVEYAAESVRSAHHVVRYMMINTLERRYLGDPADE